MLIARLFSNSAEQQWTEREFIILSSIRSILG